MYLVRRLSPHYEQFTPHLSFGGTDGIKVTCKRYIKFPHEEMLTSLGPGTLNVWKSRIPAMTGSLPLEGYCVVDACLDPTGHTIPDTLPLWPRMEGHEINIVIYVDMFNRILMKAIGGFTTHKTRNTIL